MNFFKSHCFHWINVSINTKKPHSNGVECGFIGMGKSRTIFPGILNVVRLLPAESESKSNDVDEQRIGCFNFAGGCCQE